jgi:D-arginine dehydrogenase
MSATAADILVVGAGMAGMSLAAQLAPHARVTLIEQEDQPAFHATGRSVAFWSETYGGPAVQPLTSASGPLLARPDPLLSERPLLSPRGCIHLGRAGDAGAAAALRADFAGSGVPLDALPPDALAAALPGLRPDWTIGLTEPSCSDIDVAGLFDAYRRAALRAGAVLRLGTALRTARPSGDGWRIETRDGAIDCTLLVNAAGAWADPVARACGVGPLGIQPYRRTVVQLRCPDAPAHFPLVIDMGGRFYFKPEGAGRVWLSPHDETPDMARDVVPEEIDIAIAIDRFEQVVDWTITAVERKWAGLRSFAPDRLPVYGFDPRAEKFFWFAGQGGFGIQTAPAAARLAAALILGRTPDGAVAGIDPAPYAPARLIG